MHKSWELFNTMKCHQGVCNIEQGCKVISQVTFLQKAKVLKGEPIKILEILITTTEPKIQLHLYKLMAT